MNIHEVFASGSKYKFPEDIILFLTRAQLLDHAELSVRSASKQLMVDMSVKCGQNKLTPYLQGLPQKIKTDLIEQFSKASKLGMFSAVLNNTIRIALRSRK